MMLEIEASPALTCPPLAMAREAVPLTPTAMPSVLFNVEPLPVTLTVPIEPAP